MSSGRVGHGVRGRGGGKTPQLPRHALPSRWAAAASCPRATEHARRELLVATPAAGGTTRGPAWPRPAARLLQTRLPAWASYGAAAHPLRWPSLPSGMCSTIFSASSCLRMCRAMAPEPVANFSGLVPRCARPPKIFLKAPTPTSPRKYTRRAIAAAQHAQQRRVSHQAGRVRMVACPAHPTYQPTLLRDRKAARAGLAEGGRVPRRAGPGRQRSAGSSHSPAQAEGAVLHRLDATGGGRVARGPRPTCADVVPVLVVRRKLLEGSSLDKVGPLGNLDLADTLQVRSIGDDEVLRRHVLDGDATRALLRHPDLLRGGVLP